MDEFKPATPLEVKLSHVQTDLKWDIGTAYDFFISLVVLHFPEKFALRPSWAAGVRSRLSPESRQVFETVLKVPCGPSMAWIHTLPEPKNASTMIWAVQNVPVEKRVETVICPFENSEGLTQILKVVSERGIWDESDYENLKSAYKSEYKPHFAKKSPGKDSLIKILDIWANAAEYGEKYLIALEEYFSVFFAEEEKHITGYLNNGLERAQTLSQDLPVKNLLEDLSQGLQFEEIDQYNELILVPSYWSTPLVFMDEIDQTTMILVFGVRPADESLIPGETIPDALIRGLKAVSDPTRLRILRYLAEEPATPSDLSRRLRLRPPTVTHHLKALRLAGLVQHSIESESEGKYATRKEAVEELYQLLDTFID